jgi:hypothetical protein
LVKSSSDGRVFKALGVLGDFVKVAWRPTKPVPIISKSGLKVSRVHFGQP